MRAVVDVRCRAHRQGVEQSEQQEVPQASNSGERCGDELFHFAGGEVFAVVVHFVSC